MTSRPTTLERAFELAQSGAYASISDIRAKLTAEGHRDVQGQVSGASLLSQLRRICTSARGNPDASKTAAGAAVGSIPSAP